MARILTLDIETAPAIVYAWGLFDQNVGLNQIIQPTYTLCFAAKWADEKKVEFYSVWGGDDMVENLSRLLNEADVVVHFNGKTFDVPHINRELLLAGYGPPKPYSQVDLYQVVKRQFKFLSNKLDYVSQQVLEDKKLSHSGFQLWIDVMAGDKKAQAEMEKYCKKDVILTDELYHEILPWIPNHPNVALMAGDSYCCPSCGSDDVQKRGYAKTRISTFQQYHCQNCGAWSRDATIISKTELR